MRVITALILASSALTAQDPPMPLLDRQFGAANVNMVRSEPQTKKAWRRNVVTVDEEGNIKGDQGVVVTQAESDSLSYLASNITQVAAAANAAMTNSMQYLLSSTNNMATDGFGISIAFAPTGDEAAPIGYVIKTSTTNNVDVQYVHYNRTLEAPPNRKVLYTSNMGDEVAQACKWVNWSSNGVDMVVGGKAWSGVHECRVDRPSFAQGRACLDLPHEQWGGDNGIDWGSVTLTRGGLPYYTGYVTNTVEGLVAFFDNGFLKEIKPVEQPQEEQP